MNTNERIVIDQEEVAVEKFDWGEIRWLWNGKINPDAKQTFGVVRIDPGEKNMTHIHPNCEEVLYVISGKCVHAVGDESYHLKKGMLISIPAGIKHYAINNGDVPLEAVICYSSPERQIKGTEN